MHLANFEYFSQLYKCKQVHIFGQAFKSSGSTSGFNGHAKLFYK